MEEKITKFFMTALAAAAVLASIVHVARSEDRAATLPEMRGIAAALTEQVNDLRNLHLQAAAKAASLADENAALKKQIDDLTKKTEQK